MDLHVDEQFTEKQRETDDMRQVTDCQRSLQETELIPTSMPQKHATLINAICYPLTTAAHGGVVARGQKNNKYIINCTN